MRSRTDLSTDLRSISDRSLLSDLSMNGAIVFSRRTIWVLLGLVGRWTQHFTEIDQKTRKIGQIYFWNPMTAGFIMYTLICVISMEFLSLSRRRSFARNVPSGEERGETDVFCTANMLGEMGKQVVSARAKDANKLIAWLNFFYWIRDWTNAWQSVMSKKLSQRPIDQN